MHLNQLIDNRDALINKMDRIGDEESIFISQLEEIENKIASWEPTSNLEAKSILDVADNLMSLNSELPEITMVRNVQNFLI